MLSNYSQTDFIVDVNAPLKAITLLYERFGQLPVDSDTGRRTRWNQSESNHLSDPISQLNRWRNEWQHVQLENFRTSTHLQLLPEWPIRTHLSMRRMCDNTYFQFCHRKRLNHKMMNGRMNEIAHITSVFDHRTCPHGISSLWLVFIYTFTIHSGSEWLAFSYGDCKQHNRLSCVPSLQSLMRKSKEL